MEVHSLHKGYQNTKYQIDTHIEGLSYPCNQCQKISKSSGALNVYMFQGNIKK